MRGYYTSDKYTQFDRKYFKADCFGGAQKIGGLCLSPLGKLFILTDDGVFTLSDGIVNRFEHNLLPNGASVIRCSSDGETVFASSGKLFFIFGKNGLINKREFESDIVEIKVFHNEIWILTEKSIVWTDADLAHDMLNRPLEGGTGTSFERGEKGTYAATQTNLGSLHGKRMEWQNIFPGRSGMPNSAVNDLKFDHAGYLWIATDDGAYLYDTKSLWLSPARISQLPANAVYKICFDNIGGVYFATDVGAVMLKNGRLTYFAADRWVDSNKIRDIAVTGDGSTIYAATDSGLSVISLFDYTLSEKAKYYDGQTEKYNIRHGYVAAHSPDGTVAITDNDGLWTAWYMAGQCYRYAVTGEQDALEKARRAMKAVMLLENITGIPGFPARAIRYPDEHGFGNGNHEWSLSPDGTCEWRGDTSSDEITGHFFGMAVYYDLCADAGEKELIKKSLGTIAEHIINNSFKLIDRDGKPTTWAMWNPDTLNHDDRWFGERGTNSLEMLMYLKVCEHITGDEKYTRLYSEFVSEHAFPLNTMRVKIRDAHICHIDDNLCFLSLLILLTLEKDETLRKYYLCGLEDLWSYEKIERQPFFAFIHAVFSDSDDGLSEGVRSLAEMPLDMHNYASDNENRKKLVLDTEQEPLFEPAQLKEPLPYHELNLSWPNRNVFRISSHGGKMISDGTAFLTPYWFARYNGILREAEEK